VDGRGIPPPLWHCLATDEAGRTNIRGALTFIVSSMKLELQFCARPRHDIKLKVVDLRGGGRPSSVTTVQRTNTHGGVENGLCDRAGTNYSAPYSAD
jgi:hypothetical protein